MEYYIKKLGHQELGSIKEDGKPSRGRYIYISKNKEVLNFFPPMSEKVVNDNVVLPIISVELKKKVYCNFVYHNDKISRGLSNGRNEYRLYLNNDIEDHQLLFKENDIIAVPGADVRETVAYKIAVQAVPELADKELLPIYMPMTHDKAELELNHEKGAKALEAALATGKNVVFLTLGDPTIYSTFTYVQKRVEADGYQTKLVSGITSFCATAARLNIPLTEWNQPLHVQPAVHRLDSELDQPGTYVLMKSGKKMNQVKEILARSGREVRMVENCGMPDEHIYNSVEEIPDDAGYYSLIIAKEKAEEK